MNLESHKALLHIIMDKVENTRNAGQKEYAQDIENVFGNFERIANLLEISREKVLMTYLLKHVDGIASYVKGHESQRENIRGRLTDAIVYLTLLWGMVEERDENNMENK